MKIRKILAGPVAVLVAVMAVVLLASCGSSDSGTVGSAADTEEEPVLMLQPNGVFTVDDVAAAGWKKSKELSPETLPDAIGVWYGFYNQRDVEVRIYASHDLAISSGTGPAEDAVGRGEASAVRRRRNKRHPDELRDPRHRRKPRPVVRGENRGL